MGYETLAEAEAILERGGYPLEVLKDAMLTKLTIEYRAQVVERQNEEAAAERQRQEEAREEKRREHERRMREDLPYRREMNRRAARDEWRKSMGKLPKHDDEFIPRSSS